MKSNTIDHKIFILACCLVLLIPFCQAAFGETAPPEVMAAAEAGLLPFLKSFPSEELGNFGFSPGDKISETVLGAPFQLYTITPDKLLYAKDDTPVSGLISPTGQWLFPIVLEDKSRAILTVEQMDGEWVAVSMGMAGLAVEMEKLNRQWPKAKGYEPKLIAIYQAASFFFTIPYPFSTHSYTTKHWVKKPHVLCPGGYLIHVSSPQRL